MYKLMDFLKANFTKKELATLMNKYAGVALKNSGSEFDVLRTNSAHFYRLVENVSDCIYYKENPVAILNLINGHCNIFYNKLNVDVRYLIHTIMDRVRIERGIDWRTIQCPRDLMVTMSALGFTGLSDTKGCGDAIYKFEKDSLLNRGQSLVFMWDVNNQSWVDFRKNARASFINFQDSVRRVGFSLNGVL